MGAWLVQRALVQGMIDGRVFVRVAPVVAFGLLVLVPALVALATLLSRLKAKRGAA